jgi:hypothetical protein
MVENRKWQGPDSKGVTLMGLWRECAAMVRAQERGSTVLEESDLCNELGVEPEALEAWLSEYWVEHGIRAVAEGKERCADRTLSLVRPYDGVRWDGFSPRPKGTRPQCFSVRLFSPNSKADPEWPDKLSRRGLRVLVDNVQ